MRDYAGWSEKQAMRFRDGDPETNSELLYHEDMMWQIHGDKNRPTEPYSGVTSLFNADFNDPNRKDWIIEDPYKIKFRPKT